MVHRTLIFFAAILCGLSPAWARGGGGCLREGTPVLTPDGDVPIERLAVGDHIVSFANGTFSTATVLACYEVAAESTLELRTEEAVLYVTAEHPIMVGQGVFRTAGSLRQGDTVYVRQGEAVSADRLRSVTTVQAYSPAYNLLVSSGGTFVAAGIVVHNKGCFVGDTPILRGDGTETSIRDIRPGDDVLAFSADEQIVRTVVRSVLSRQVDETLVVIAGSTRLVVTPEHPFYVGQGTYRTIDALAPGDRVFVYDGGGVSLQPIASIQHIHAAATVYNLQADPPHTFFAGGVVVHNKGGGGGCFPAGTKIQTPVGTIPIERIRPGQQVLAVDSDGRPIVSVVEETFATLSDLAIVETESGILWTTVEHPLWTGGGEFRRAGEIRSGQMLGVWRDGRLDSVTVRSVSLSSGQVAVFNLRVGQPHTFIADGFVVHNKGGGGGGFHGGGFSSRGSRSTGTGGGKPMDPSTGLWIGFIVVGVISMLVIKAILTGRSKEEQDLDYVYSQSDIAPKATKTLKLLEFIARQDSTFQAETLVAATRATFVKLQECWQGRSYDPMRDLLMPDLYGQHCLQLQGLKRNHEINVIEGLDVQKIDLVNVRYTHKPNEREFTALITARARDYYVDDRTQKFLRGDYAPATFQEFWTFQLQDGRWLLREVEQTRESDVLKDENFFEPFTDANVDQIYGDSAGKTGQAGPWLEKHTQVKATRIDRLLNYLVQTDKLWNRQAMVQRARDCFMNVYLARESNDTVAVNAEALFPDIARSLCEEITDRVGRGVTVEFRNLCVRKVELVLVRNYSDNRRDEFTVRISAHVQQMVSHGGVVTASDPHVMPFEEYWTFGRLDNSWKLKEVLPKARGDEAMEAENLDEDSTPSQVQWYYRQTRAN